MADSYFRVTNMTQIHTPGLKAWHIYSYFRVTNMRQTHTSGLQTWQIHTSGLQTWDRFILQGYKHETDSYFHWVKNMIQIHTSGLQTCYRIILWGYRFILHESHISWSHSRDRFTLQGYIHEVDSRIRVTNRIIPLGYRLVHPRPQTNIKELLL